MGGFLWEQNTLYSAGESGLPGVVHRGSRLPAAAYTVLLGFVRTKFLCTPLCRLHWWTGILGVGHTGESRLAGVAYTGESRLLGVGYTGESRFTDAAYTSEFPSWLNNMEKIRQNLKPSQSTSNRTRKRWLTKKIEWKNLVTQSI
jgi:hypothetical protein